MASTPNGRRAAQYLRMSTEHQDHSLAFQRATNGVYALEHGYEIVRTYEDAGISGLGINNRPGLQALLADVLRGDPGFGLVLVFDVSRWGRFQNPDQSAYYEFMCAEAGVRVEYCAEPFDNDGAPTSVLLKQIKRAMAAEYSRELSRKVTLARRSLRAEGCWTGGRPPYGYRAEVLDRMGRRSVTPDSSVWKKKQGVHARLVLGPEEEARTVRRMFNLYLRPKASDITVARWLNENNIPNVIGGRWTCARVAYLLKNEIYAGRLMGRYGMTAVGSGKKLLLPKEEWTIAEGAAPAIVSKRTFRAAQQKRAAERPGSITDQAVFADARRIAEAYGTVSVSLLAQHGRWGPLLYQRRFGGMQRLRAMLGVEQSPQHRRLNDRLKRAGSERWKQGKLYSDDEVVALLRELLAQRGFLSADLIDQTPWVPTSQTCRRRFGDLGEVYRHVGYHPAPHQIAAGRAAWGRRFDYDPPGRSKPQF